MTILQETLDQLSINTLRTLAIDAVEGANSGHPGLPMGAAPMAYTLWTRFLKHNPKNPQWFDRDRFILSAGHGSALLYALLHISGYDLPLEELKNFRQWGSRTPGHPEFGHTPGVEATTGPLGQGVAMAVGMAMAERHLAAVYNQGVRVVDHYTYALCGDGDLMEGVSAEAASLAGHLKLGKLVVLYDSNDISLDGETSYAFTENVAQRFQAYGWQVLRVEDGNDVEAISAAIAAARSETERPSLVEIKTVIGYGSPNKAGKSSAHGSPLGKEEIQKVREAYNWPHAPFTVPNEVISFFSQKQREWEALEAAWKTDVANYAKTNPHLHQQFSLALTGALPDAWEEALPQYRGNQKAVATRSASGDVLNALSQTIPAWIGGSADLASSNKTTLKNAGVYHADDYSGRNIWFGVREHAMGAILNGMALHGGVRVFGATFLVFSDYLRPALRLSALMRLPVTYIFTHDSIAVGEDGPTHEPIEHLASLRCIPNLNVWRPANALETVEAYRYVLSRPDEGPAALALSRQDLPILSELDEKVREGTPRGAYILSEAKGSLQALLLATGSEVSLALAAQQALAEEGISVSVISMPCWEVFERQPETYRRTVLPPHVEARLALEMGSSFGWERYVGTKGHIMGIDQFGASAPGERVMEEYGFSVENVVQQVKQTLHRLNH